MTRPTGRPVGRPSTTWTPAAVVGLRDLIAAGLGPVAIAEALGTTANAVKGRLKALGLRTRLLCQVCRAAPPVRFGRYCAACGLARDAARNERRRAEPRRPATAEASARRNAAKRASRAAAKEARTRASHPRPMPTPPKTDLRIVRPSVRPAAPPGPPSQNAPPAAAKPRTCASRPRPVRTPPRPRRAPTAPLRAPAGITIADIPRERWRAMLRRVAAAFTDEPLTF